MHLVPFREAKPYSIGSNPAPLRRLFVFATVARTSNCKFWRMHGFLRSEKTHRETNQSNVERECLLARFAAVRKNTQETERQTCVVRQSPGHRRPSLSAAWTGQKRQLNSGSPAHASVASRHWHARRIGICLPPLCAADFHMIQLVASPGWTLRHELEHAASNLEAILVSQVVPQSFPELWTPLTKNIVHVFVPFRHLFPRPEHKVRMRSHPAVHPALSILQATGGDFPRLSSLSLSFPISFLSTFPLKVFPITLSFFAFSFPFAIPHPWPIFFSFLAITFSFGLPTPTRPRSPVVWPIIIPGVKTSVDCLRWRLPCLWDRRLRWSRCLRWCSAGLGAPGSGAPLWSLHLFHRSFHQVLAHATFAILLNDPSPVSAVRVCQSIGEHLAQPHKRIGRHRVGTDRCGGQKSHTTVAAGRKATLLDNYHLWLKIWIWDCLMNDVLWFCRMKHSNVKLQLTTKVENIRMNVNYMSEWHFLMHLLMINKISHAYGAKANMPDLIYSADKKIDADVRLQQPICAFLLRWCYWNNEIRMQKNHLISLLQQIVGHGPYTLQRQKWFPITNGFNATVGLHQQLIRTQKCFITEEVNMPQLGLPLFTPQKTSWQQPFSIYNYRFRL